MSVAYLLAPEPSEALRQRALLALGFAVAHRAIAAFCYGIAPQMRMTIDFRERSFTAGRQRVSIPLSRLLEGSPAFDIDGAALTQAFSAHCLRERANCTMLDLSNDSAAICAVAGVSRGVRDAILFGDRALPSDVARSAADRIDVVMLMLVGDVVSGDHAQVVRMLEDIQRTGATSASRAHWVGHAMRLIGWDVPAESVLIALDAMISPARPSRSPRERMSARARLAEALHG